MGNDKSLGGHMDTPHETGSVGGPSNGQTDVNPRREHDFATSRESRERFRSPRRRREDIGSGRNRDSDMDRYAIQPDKRSRSRSPRARPHRSPVRAKELPSLVPSGRLAAESNGRNSVKLLYQEPPDSGKPPASKPWRLFLFRKSETTEEVLLASRSSWLLGSERLVADLLLDSTTCSKQHAVIQFRYITRRNTHGDREGQVRPYIMDLESAHGTKLNGARIPHSRYVELKDSDVLRFGRDATEFVVLLPT